MLEYFKNQKQIHNPKFLHRFKYPSFKGQDVLDLGCGHGALTIDIAESGAKTVVGIDLRKPLIECANKILTTCYPFLIDNVKFIKTDMRDLGKVKFDIIISKDTFEHIIDLDKLLPEIKEKLRIGGRLIAGFGPLYYSPWGDHNLLKHRLPWTHLFLRKRYFKKRKINIINNLGLNMYSFTRYEELFNNTKGLKVISFETNVVDNTQYYCNSNSFYPTGRFFNINVFFKLFNKMFKFFSAIPGLRNYFVYNIFLVMKKVE